MPDPTSHVYVVVGGQGEYSDYREWPVRAFTDEASARRVAGQMSAETRELYRRLRDVEREDAAARDAIRADVTKIDPELDFDEIYDPIDYMVWEVPLDDGSHVKSDSHERREQPLTEDAY